ncbi:uncharacterized protein PG998_002344 [Apiospora kogelbergensis]|uniref:Uncharacterized protein n=1 Tax=Apiospora kogelbergensis TaxID=1337665 RepID=A0AAW0Q6Z8_9PEZI
MASQGNESGGQEDRPQTSADLPFYPQRLYSKRLKAEVSARARLQATAYTLLDDGAKATILSAVDAELRTQIEALMRSMAPREMIPYDKLAEAVITKVFYNNLELFVFGDEDMPTVEEIVNYQD